MEALGHNAWGYLSALGYGVVTFVCAWAVVCPRVKDGLLGKFLIIILCFASFSSACWAVVLPQLVTRPEGLFVLTIATLFLRYFWLQMQAQKRHKQVSLTDV